MEVSGRRLFIITCMKNHLMLSVGGLLTGLCPIHAQMYPVSQNGQVHMWEIDSFANPGGNEVTNYTGTFYNGSNWSLQTTDANPGDGLESQAQNPYNQRYDPSGARNDIVATFGGPWGNPDLGIFKNSTSGTAINQNSSYYQGFGDYQLTGNSDLLGFGGQTYFSTTTYTFTFATPQTDVYLYIGDLDDSMLSNFNIIPSVLTFPSSVYNDYPGSPQNANAALAYDAANNILLDVDGKGEGTGLGTLGLSWQLFPFLGNQSLWNPSASGVVRFSDPLGFSTLTFTNSLLDSQHDGNTFESSDGAFFALGIGTTQVPEPTVSAIGILTLFGFAIRRRR